MGRVDVAAPGEPAVTFTYLGVGGWIISWGEAQILTGPLFTNPGLVTTGLGEIRTDTAAVDAFMALHPVGEARAILVGHGHYDHLMDVPRVATKHAPRAPILATRTIHNLLGTWTPAGARVREVEPFAGDKEHPGRWMDLGAGVRVMPLRSHHAPHFNGHTLYSGTADVPRRTEPSLAEEWVDGPTFAFLIDFYRVERGDTVVVFRTYYQDAVAAPPYGLAPRPIMKKRPVDVAIVVPATFDQVDWHPERLILNLRPRWVLLGHWENFFKPPDPKRRSVMMTDMGHFEGRLKRVFAGKFWRPGYGTVFRFPVR